MVLKKSGFYIKMVEPGNSLDPLKEIDQWKMLIRRVYGIGFQSETH